MNKYKVVAVVEAMQLDFHDNNTVLEIMEWAGDRVKFFNFDPTDNHYYGCKVKTPDGVLVSVMQKDWIIKGVTGEFFSCDADTFVATYESV